jgi:hypothetical protein
MLAYSEATTTAHPVNGTAMNQQSDGLGTERKNEEH